MVLATALEKDRDRRYQTAEALAEDLRRVRAREPILARPAGPWLRFRRWVERNPAVALFLVTTLVSLAAGVAATGTSLVCAGGSEEDDLGHLDAAQRERRVGAIREYGARMTAARAGLETENTAEARRHLESTASADPAFEWRAADHQLRREVARIRTEGPVEVLDAGGEDGFAWRCRGGKTGGWAPADGVGAAPPLPPPGAALTASPYRIVPLDFGRYRVVDPDSGWIHWSGQGDAARFHAGGTLVAGLVTPEGPRDAVIEARRAVRFARLVSLRRCGPAEPGVRHRSRRGRGGDRHGLRRGEDRPPRGVSPAGAPARPRGRRASRPLVARRPPPRLGGGQSLPRPPSASGHVVLAA